MSKFPIRLKELREEKGLLGKDFAKIMSVEPATVTNWEKGNRFPKDDVLIKIADYFDCSTDYLLGRTDDKLSKVYSGTLHNQTIEIEIDKGFPHELTAEEVQNIIKQLDAVGLDVNKLIENSKKK
ncbi:MULTISPECIES: helix-turn-helix domain-containing protein [Clostridium]|uniref:HTH cro/C1-type domain-containing protein n=3 Tax=Clostridium TaxID=1485 RepID=A0AAV3VWF3_9CLOT|nr:MULTISPECIES: helix-turn-helix transcriptional regulator [Clostridium]NOW07456.1 transcriptional regulator with XRE-family HTH domain [Clostridium beijerinckii]NRT75118.1 transcriptional regulator with XRE-family HTH domain [Clostridium beijerinckii]NSB17213.1 transcriptional regulator with XRE-family HTH domain [Clostridium beijerinckii]NYC04771.1 transcriptional regulator with XRE-family HTH domain [Clostridium beijerinckii]OOM24780.1 HTH-type transcriptional regulator ImmR [Clostridium b